MAVTISALIPELQPWCRQLVLECGKAGLMPRITSTLRTHADQTRLYRRYLAGLQPYFVAKPGTSAHEYGYAFDLVVSPMESLYDVGQLWESWGGEWGGTGRYGHPDPVHFQYPGFRVGTVPDVRQQKVENDFGIFPFSAPSKAQRAGVELATNIPGVGGVLASAGQFLTDLFFPDEP